MVGNAIALPELCSGKLKMISISSQVQTADEIELSADLIRLLPIGLICVYSFFFIFTVQILCIGTDRSQQTVQTKIRLLLKK